MNSCVYETKNYPMGLSVPALGLNTCKLYDFFFKHLLLQNRLVNQSQISCGTSLGNGTDGFYKWYRSHDQDDLHTHL